MPRSRRNTPDYVAAREAFVTRQRPRSEQRHVTQALKASESWRVAALHNESLAKKFALRIIELFPDVRPAANESRTAVATSLARAGLDPLERQQKNQLRLGQETANEALMDAHKMMSAYEPVKLSKVS
ncbi:MAG: hypothetical protein ABIR91_06070 [Candidatus Saccharimonadales bacterium]